MIEFEAFTILDISLFAEEFIDSFICPYLHYHRLLVLYSLLIVFLLFDLTVPILMIL